MALETYVKHVHTSACFDTVVEVQSALNNNDSAGAMFHLGELREQLWLLHNFIESLETAPSNSPEVAGVNQ